MTTIVFCVCSFVAGVSVGVGIILWGLADA